ncbi:MAG: ComF family protein [Eubacteriales bacterium]|nr:ComF family protein [Eubacteriales bacterium]
MRSLVQTLLCPQENTCHLCGTLLSAGEQTLCVECEQALKRRQIHAFEAPSTEYPPIALVLSAYWFDEEARQLVHQLKFSADYASALPLAEGMAGLYADFRGLIGVVDGVIPVPVHPSRFRLRGYNQAEVLANAFCRHTSLPLFADLLLRVQHGSSQVQRSRAERFTAMEGAFRAAKPISGGRFLLIDDVLTTGATAIACTKCLLEAGADSVVLLTACRA